MSKFYDEAGVLAELRRDFDVYDRTRELGIELGTFEENVASLQRRNIAGLVFHASGPSYLAGVGMVEKASNGNPE